MKGLIFEMSCQDHNQISLPSSVRVVVLLLSEKEEKLHIRYCYFKSLLCPDQFKLIFMGENLWKFGQKQSTIHQNNEILCLLLEMLGFDAAMIFQKSTLSQVLMNSKSKELCERVDFLNVIHVRITTKHLFHQAYSYSFRCWFLAVGPFNTWLISN